MLPTLLPTWPQFISEGRYGGPRIVDAEHEKLKAHGVWIWTQGTIEDVLGITDKGEQAIQELEQSLPGLGKADLQAQHREIAAFLEWLHN